MAKLKEQGVDILKSFVEDSYIYYYDPSAQWRLFCDFQKIFETLEHNPERLLDTSSNQ